MPEYVAEKRKLKYHNLGTSRKRLFPTVWAPSVVEAEAEAAMLWPKERLVVSRLRMDVDGPS